MYTETLSPSSPTKPLSHQPRLIGRIDIKGPNVVKGIHLEGLRIVGKPEELAPRYYQSGIDELVYMDIVASLYGRNSLVDIVSETAKDIFVPLTVGGGIRTLEDIRALLRAGADKVAVNTAAVKNPDFITEAAKRFGQQCVVVSIEAKHKDASHWEAYTDNGREPTGLDVFEWAKRAEDLGAGEIMLTSVDQEGTLKGFDIPLTQRVSETLNIPVIASGGAGSAEHVCQAMLEGRADAVAVAAILHKEKTTVAGIKDAMNAAGIPVRR